MFKNINDMDTREKIEYYINKIMIAYFEDKDINLIELAEEYLSKDEINHLKELQTKLFKESNE